jgi:hypothetical protein
MMKNRIKDHRKVRAGDLVPHELNPRRHSKAQRAALAALYEEIGFARSVLAYELPDGRLKLIDGHLRKSMDPDAVIDVEVLDVNDSEARALLLAIDPLAQLAEYDDQALAQLRSVAEADSAAVRSLWQTLEEDDRKASKRIEEAETECESCPEKFFVWIECADEEEQLTLLQRFQAEGLTCHCKII